MMDVKNHGYLLMMNCSDANDDDGDINDNNHNNLPSTKLNYIKSFVSNIIHHGSHQEHMSFYHQSIIFSVEMLLSQGDVMGAKHVLLDNIRVLNHVNSQYLCYLSIILSSAHLIEIATKLYPHLVQCSGGDDDAGPSPAMSTTTTTTTSPCPSMHDVIADPLLFARCVSIVLLASKATSTSMKMPYDNNYAANNAASTTTPTSSSHHRRHHRGNNNYHSADICIREVCSYRQQCKDILKELQLHFAKFTTIIAQCQRSHKSSSMDGVSGDGRTNGSGNEYSAVDRLDILAMYVAFLVGCNKRDKV